MPEQLPAHPRGQVAHQRSTPGGPRGGSGSAGVGLGERSEQVESLHRADEVGDQRRRGRVLEVPARGDRRQEQVVTHERRHGVDVVRREAHALAQGLSDDGAGRTVVTGPSLAHVVQQSGNEQEVGPVHRPGEGGSLGHGLDRVPVDGVPVDRGSLRTVSDALPVRQPPHDEAGGLEVLPDRDSVAAGPEEAHEVVAHRSRPGQREVGGLGDQTFQGGDRQRHPCLRGSRCRTHGKRRVVGDVDVSSQHRLSLVLDHSLGQRPTGRSAPEHRSTRPSGEGAAHAAPGDIARVDDRATRLGDPT